MLGLFPCPNFNGEACHVTANGGDELTEPDDNEDTHESGRGGEWEMGRWGVGNRERSCMGGLKDVTRTEPIERSTRTTGVVRNAVGRGNSPLFGTKQNYR